MDEKKFIQNVAVKDTKSKRQMCEDDFKNTIGNYDETGIVGKVTDVGAELKKTIRGRNVECPENYYYIIENDPILGGAICFNEFSGLEIFIRDIDLPYGELIKSGLEVSDSHVWQILLHISDLYGLKNRNMLEAGITAIARKHKFHPVRNYIKSQTWDNRKRIGKIFSEYLGAVLSAYTDCVERKFLVALVARVMNPGCKFDYMPVLISEQGKGKSTMVRKLGLEWYSDCFLDLRSKDAQDSIQGVWLHEWGELSGMRKADLNKLKGFVTMQTDRYRVAFGRRTSNFPRQTVFIGTTNETDFLTDPSGNRRFWPIMCGINKPAKSVFTDLNEYEVGQIWAEAYVIFLKGEPLFLTPEIEAIAREAQKAHTEIDERATPIKQYLETLLPPEWYKFDSQSRRAFLSGDPFSPTGSVKRQKICPLEVWCECYGKDKADFAPFQQREIHNILRNIEGWKAATSNLSFGAEYKSQRGYVREQSANKPVFTDSATNKDSKKLNGKHVQYEHAANELN